MNNLYVCIISSENNNKQYLVSYFYKHVAFLLSFFKKRTCTFRRSSYIFDKTCNTLDEAVQRQHLNQSINIYLHRDCHETSFIRCFIVTAENLIWWPVVFLFLCSWWPAEENFSIAALYQTYYITFIASNIST